MQVFQKCKNGQISKHFFSRFTFFSPFFVSRLFLTGANFVSH